MDPQTAVMHLTELNYQFAQLGGVLPAHLEAPVFEHATGPGDYMQQSQYKPDADRPRAVQRARI